ncbi:Putative ATP-dependent RNA helicase DHX57 [Frankliniella fusca]|uniref:ATP-dependent RNA helicase DHX57 n=1 Tax=Frankliniella fusca TaxID=407009 RepID=A0AAE1HFN0_9NEOP|nr:Putative ATP-dependent RNA helicase DHX57 [Frankliniella fusca]
MDGGEEMRTSEEDEQDDALDGIGTHTAAARRVWDDPDDIRTMNASRSRPQNPSGTGCTMDTLDALGMVWMYWGSAGRPWDAMDVMRMAQDVLWTQCVYGIYSLDAEDTLWMLIW